MKKVENIVPINQGKKITDTEAKSICLDYIEMFSTKTKKKDIAKILQDKYGRGRFAIKNILDKYLEQYAEKIDSSKNEEFNILAEAEH